VTWLKRKAPLGRKNGDRFGVKKFEAYGESFRSKLEFAVRNLLMMREKAGELEILQREATVYLHAAKFKYIPDFKCLDKATGKIFFVEAKGVETDVWRRNYRLWKFHGPGNLEIWKGNASNPKLVETVIPLDCCPACGRPEPTWEDAHPNEKSPLKTSEER